MIVSDTKPEPSFCSKADVASARLGPNARGPHLAPDLDRVRRRVLRLLPGVTGVLGVEERTSEVLPVEVGRWWRLLAAAARSGEHEHDEHTDELSAH
jgi:hypothetical protein